MPKKEKKKAPLRSYGEVLRLLASKDVVGETRRFRAFDGTGYVVGNNASCTFYYTFDWSTFS